VSLQCRTGFKANRLLSAVILPNPITWYWFPLVIDRDSGNPVIIFVRFSNLVTNYLDILSHVGMLFSGVIQNPVI
jgi:hypothetical protein